MTNKSDDRLPERFPVRLIKPVSIRQGFGESGFFIPHRKQYPSALIVDWSGKTSLIFLSGENKFNFFSQEINSAPLRGVLIADCEFVVDVASHYDSVAENDPLGALVINDGGIHLIAARLNQGFADPVLVPLWGDFTEGSKDEAIGFAKWSLIRKDGDDVHTIWTNADQ